MSVLRLTPASLFCLGLTATILPSLAVAAPIVQTFESFANSTVITNQIPNLTFTAPPGEARIAIASSPVIPGEPAGLAYFNTTNNSSTGDFRGPIIIDFSPGASLVGAVIDFGNIGNGVTLSAYDGPNATGTQLDVITTTKEQYIQVVAPGIQSVKFDVNPPTTVTYLIDNLTYDLVPEPASTALLSLVWLLSRRCRAA